MQNIASKKTFLKLIKVLNQVNEYGRRHDYAFRISNGRTESTKDLTESEAIAVVKELETKHSIVDLDDVMRKKIISYAHYMFWELPGGRADMQRINNWCIEKGPYKKVLNAHTTQELPILVGVFEKMYKQYMNKL